MPTPQEILDRLRKVSYPGFSRDIVAFGLVKDIEVGGLGVTITLSPTTENPAALAEIKRLEAAKEYENPRYMELMIPHHYTKHFLRMPAEKWPDPVNRAFKHLNTKIYVPMQGPSELGASGKLANWDRTADLPKISIPTLVIGARYDTMDPKHMEWMAGQVKRGRYLSCPNGSHLAVYDDQKVYFDGLVRFIRDVEQRRF